MGGILASSTDLVLPAGGIAGALAVIIVTLVKVRLQQKENQNNWAIAHMDRLTKERDDADTRADLFLEKLDAERELRVAAQNDASRLQGINEALGEQLEQARTDINSLRSRLGPLEL